MKHRLDKNVSDLSSPDFEVDPEGSLEADDNAICIHNSVIAIISRIAASKVPGVYDLAGSFVDEIAGMVGKRKAERGVHVTIEDDHVSVDIHVIVEYGIYIPKVAWQVQKDVREAIEKMTGKSIKAVNVLIQGVSLSSKGE